MPIEHDGRAAGRLRAGIEMVALKQNYPSGAPQPAAHRTTAADSKRGPSPALPGQARQKRLGISGR